MSEIIERAGRAALARYLAAEPDEQEPTTASQERLWSAVARAVIEVMREPTEEIIVALVEHGVMSRSALEHWWPAAITALLAD